MAKTDAVWEKFGSLDPYFGVLSHDRFRADNIGAHKDEFFRSGRDTVASFLGRCEKHFGTIRHGRALDFGCGVGRLTLALSERFAETVGLDISTSMLKEARANAAGTQHGRVGFGLADDALSEADGTYDFVLSYIVLQHIPVDRGIPIILNLIDKVAPGGGFVLHFSVRDFGVLSSALYWTRHNVPGMNTVRNIVSGQPLGTLGMQMNDYPLHRILDLLNARGITEVLTFTERHEKLLTVGLIGRVPGGDPAPSGRG